MNYFNAAEKALKNCFKKKFSITTATIVGFLIAGSVGFGMNITQEEVNKSQGQEISGGKKTVIYTQDKDNTINETLENKKTDEKTEENSAVVSDASWLVTVTNGNLNIGEKGVLKGTNLSRTTLNLYGDTNTINNGTIEKADKGWGAVTLNAIDNATGKLINNGKIDGNINVEGNVIINNTRDINASIYSDNNKGNKVIDITNSGNIGINKTNEGGKGNTEKNSAIFIKSGSGGLKLVNEGTIGNKNLDNGVVVQAIQKLDILNSKDIVVKQSGIISSAKETNIKNSGTIEGGKFGIYLSKALSLNYNIENSGLIEVKQEKKSESQVIGVRLQGTGEAINATNGKIKVTGQGYDTNPKLYIVGVANSGGKFINEGLIELGKGTTYGIGIQAGKNGEVVNKGTIALEVGTNENDKTTLTNNLAIRNDGGLAMNTGKIQITDKTAEQLKDFDIYSVLVGTIANKGILLDKDGNIVSQKDDVEISGDMGIDDINNAGGLGGAIIINKDSTLTGGEDSIKAAAINIGGNTLTIKNDTSSKGVTFDKTVINLAKQDGKNGKIVVGDKAGADLVINNGKINGIKDNSNNDIELKEGSTLTLNGTSVNGNIGTIESSLSNSLAQTQGVTTVNVLGDSSLDGIIDVTEINIGTGTSLERKIKREENSDRKNKFTLSSDSMIGEGVVGGENSSSNTINIKEDGQLVLEVGANGETALGNSSGVNVTGTNIERNNSVSMTNNNNGDILLSTGSINGETLIIDLGKNNTFTNTTISMENGNTGVYTGSVNKDNTIKLDYNKELFKEDKALNTINNSAMNVNNLFENTDLVVRKKQMSNIYEGSIYSETVRAAYDSVKTFENILRGVNTINETGKWTAFGSGVYNRNTYDRAGYDAEIETSGLLAGIEYGIDTDTIIGFSFAGANQDVDSITGKADGTTLYLGTYARKYFGNYKFLAGLGYQYGDYDTDNTTGYVSSSASYKSNVISTYVEGRYSVDLGSEVTFEPKLKLGYTYVEQDNARDVNFRASDTSLSNFDTELGIDLIKTYTLKSGKANIVLGTSYVKTMGDTDKYFTGSFTNGNGKFDIKGAKLTENSGKFNLALEVVKDSGIFYNGGLNLQVGSDNYRNYGVNLGLGYKF